MISSGRLNRVLVMMWQLFSDSCDKPCSCSYVTILIIIKSPLIALIFTIELIGQYAKLDCQLDSSSYNVPYVNELSDMDSHT